MRTQLLILSLIASALASATQTHPTYQMTHSIKLGGEGGWDYLAVDSGAHRLYLSRGTHLMIVDTRTNKLIGDLQNTAGVHGAAWSNRAGLGFTSNGRDNTSTEFNLKSLKAIKSIPVGQRPDAIIYEPTSDRIFTFNAGTTDVTAIDVKTGTVAGSVKVDGKPEFPACDGKGSMFVNVEDKNEIQQIDPQSLKVVNTWSIAPVEEPSGLAIDPVGHLLFAVGSNQKMAIVDYTTGKLVASPTIGNGPDAAAFDPKYGLAFSSNGQDGTVSVVGRDSNGEWATLQTVQTRKGARTMAIDPATHKIYLVTADFVAAEQTEGTRQRRQMVPGSFTLLVVEPKGSH